MVGNDECVFVLRRFFLKNVACEKMKNNPCLKYINEVPNFGYIIVLNYSAILNLNYVTNFEVQNIFLIIFALSNFVNGRNGNDDAD